MTDSNIAAAIRAAFKKREESREAYIEASVEIAMLFATKREEHESDQAFGRWLIDNDLDNVGSHDRAALIAMGRHPEAMRTRLQDHMADDSGGYRRNFSLRYFYEDNRDWFAYVGKPTPSEPEPAESPESLAQIPEITQSALPENVVELRIAPRATAPTEPVEDLTKRAPKLAKVLSDPVLMKVVLDRMGGKRAETFQLLYHIGGMKGGKPALQRWAETLRDHPDWQPAHHEARVTVRLLNASMSTAASAVVRKTSPDGLNKAIDRALEVASRINRPLPPRPTFASRPPRPTPTEVPMEDTAIIIQGVTIRERGEDPAAYPMVWSAVRAWEMIDGMVRMHYPNPGQRAAILDYAIPFIRDVDSDILASVFRDISTALKKGPKDGSTKYASPRPRIKA